MYDIFISYASEDRNLFVAPLAEELTRRGLHVWYDQLVLRLGDRLTDLINEGLSKSRYGAVVLSPHFLAKEWTKRELSGLFARESDGKKIILPIWHGISKADLLVRYPELADRVAAQASDGISAVADAICRVDGLNAQPNAARYQEIRESQKRLSAEKERIEDLQLQEVTAALQRIAKEGGRLTIGGIAVHLSADCQFFEAILGDISSSTGSDLSRAGWEIDGYTNCRGRWPTSELSAVAWKIWHANVLEGFQHSVIFLLSKDA